MSRCLQVEDIDTDFSDMQKVLGLSVLSKLTFILSIEVVTKQLYINSDVHYMTQNMWTTDQSHPYLLVEHLCIDLVPFSVKIASIILERLYTRFWSTAVVICPKSHKSISAP